MSLICFIFESMSLRSIAQNFNAFLNNWEQLRVDRVLQLAKDVNALRKSRVINDRVDHQGNSFGIYAPSTQAKKEKENNNVDTSNTTLFDSGFGSLPYPNYNFNDTGEMWQSTQPRIIQQITELIIVRIEPAREDRRKVMEILDGKYGPINQLSDAELEFITETINGWVQMDLSSFNLN